MAKVKATRMELLKLKKKAKLAQKGHKLLKEKRDALISEFFKLVENLKDQRQKMEEQLSEAYKSLILAQAITGVNEVELAANSTPIVSGLQHKHSTIMGVKVPKLSIELKDKTAFDRGYSLMSSVEMDNAAKKFELVLSKLVKLAETEATAAKLAEEIKKTKRKVNALEKVVIPKIEETIIYIKMRLEEMERENFSRLKIIKKRMEE